MFEPRIVVPNDDDWSTVVAALIDYQVGILTRVRVMQTGLREALQEVERSTGIIRSLCDQAESEAAKTTFGEIPDDLSKLGENLEP